MHCNAFFVNRQTQIANFMSRLWLFNPLALSASKRWLYWVWLKDSLMGQT